MRALIVCIALIALATAQYGSYNGGADDNKDPKATHVVQEAAPDNTCKGRAQKKCADKCKAHCNNGVGNGPDCRPGRARYSNDDHGGVPGSPGSKHGDARGTKYLTRNKGDERIVADGGSLDSFLGDASGEFKKNKCHDDCEDAEFAACEVKEEEVVAVEEEVKAAVVIPENPAPTCAVTKGAANDCQSRAKQFCGPKTTSAFTTCREVFNRVCQTADAFPDAESCLRSCCDNVAGDKWHSQAEKRKACREGDKGSGGVGALCAERVCVKAPVPKPVPAPPKKEVFSYNPEVPKEAKRAEKPAEEPKVEKKEKVEEPKPAEKKVDEPKPAEKKVDEPKPAEKKVAPVAPQPTVVAAPAAPCVHSTIKLNGAGCGKAQALRKEIKDLNCVINSMLAALEGPNGNTQTATAQTVVKAKEVVVEAVKEVKTEKATDAKKVTGGYAAPAAPAAPKAKSVKAATRGGSKSVKKARSTGGYAAPAAPKAKSVKAATRGGSKSVKKARSTGGYGAPKAKSVKAGTRGGSKSRSNRGGYGGRRSVKRSVGKARSYGGARRGGSRHGGYGGKARSVRRGGSRHGGYGGKARSVRRSVGGYGRSVRRSVGGGYNGGARRSVGRSVGGGYNGGARRSVGGGGRGYGGF